MRCYSTGKQQKRINFSKIPKFLFSFQIQFAGDQFALTCAQTIPRLIEVVQAPKSREPENVNPTENAISAITKILKYNSSALPNIDEIIMLWLVKLTTQKANEMNKLSYRFRLGSPGCLL